MNKKISTLIFMLGATLLNLIILAVVAALLVLLFGLLYRGAEEVSDAMSWLAVIVILFGSIAGTFWLYSRIIKWMMKKWNLESRIEHPFRNLRRR